MSVATSTALIIGGGLAAAGGVASSLIGSDASKTASAQQVAQQDQALALQKSEFDTQQANLAPWLSAGKVSLAQLMQGLQPGGNLSTPFAGTFTPPTLEDAQKTPGYQFAQQAGEQGIEHGASAAGGAFTSGELANLASFNNNLAQNAYQQTYNNALNTFGTQFNTYNTNQANLYNKLASTSGLGQVTANDLGNLGNTATAQQANTLTNIGSAQAAGTVGSANAYNSGLGLITNGLGGSLSLSALMNGGFGGNTNSQPTAPQGPPYVPSLIPPNDVAGPQSAGYSDGTPLGI